MGSKKRKGRAVKNAQKGSVSTEAEELVKAPHTFVISRGNLGKNVSELLLNFRKVMEPFTASRLKVQKHNVVKDFVSVAGLLHVTHMVVFTKTEQSVYMRVARLPRGPTLTFQVENYSLMRDVLSSLKKKVTYSHQYANHPLLVLNNFSGEGMHLKLITSMFQNMFPSININTVKLNTIRRCLLLNFQPETNTIDFRHYTIKVAPSGISKSIKKIVQSKVPDLSSLTDISEFVDMQGGSESEAELDGTTNQVVLPQKISSRGNAVNQQSSVRLLELGPRMTLKLVKIEEGLMQGEVMYHAFVSKSKEEVQELRLKKAKKRKLKEKRRREQEENRKKKEAAKSKDDGTADEAEGAASGDEADDDREWYRLEVGEEPDEDLMSSKKTKRKAEGSSNERSPKKPRPNPATGAKRSVKKGNADEEDGSKKRSSAQLSDFDKLMQRRKKKKKLKEKTKQQRLITSKVARLRAAQNQKPMFNKNKRRRNK
ncbi:suppressor of SWI4 1 homolog [Ornithodoros turicata]|uniref:suppressor of SWI4 1 homolog n=1 Tax=Ornithodoros turicata TaxID=34597 RepID=UPI00313A198B